MKTNIKLFIAVNVLVFVLWGCGAKEETKKEESHNEQNEVVKLSAESIKQIKLETETVSLQTFTGYLTIPAKVITVQDNEAQIGSLVQGRVHDVLVKIGDYVKAGQILMYVEGLEIGVVKSGYLKAKANYDFTKADLDRHKLLMEQNIGSKQSYYEAEAEYKKAKAEFQAEDKKIHSIGLSDEDVTEANLSEEHTSGTLPIKSSINGIVVERNVVMGQYVDATTNAFKVINTSTVWVDGQIYEMDLTKINQKTNALFTSATYQNEKFNGRIIYIGQTVDEQSRTITVRGEFDNANNKLKPQMFGELKIPVSANAKAIMIPEEAVIKEAGQEFVFVQTSDTTTPSGGQAFGQRKVITGTSVGSRIEIKEGLKEGEKVVSKGVFYLKSELKKDELAGD
ncbi:MAG: efflux RND transporter periplasmic adaptor subunit [Ignavibacteriales bacterium]|nr:efflux RND transporter periplasmic adaptor subunit [Ignavibacteriales bacterium]